MLPSAAWDLPAQFPWCPVLPLELDGILDPPPSRRFSPFSEFFRRKNNVLREEGKRAVGYSVFFF